MIELTFYFPKDNGRYSELNRKYSSIDKAAATIWAIVKSEPRVLMNVGAWSNEAIDYLRWVYDKAQRTYSK